MEAGMESWTLDPVAHVFFTTPTWLMLCKTSHLYEPYGDCDGHAIQGSQDPVQLANSALIHGKYLQWHFLYKYLFCSNNWYY